MIPWNGPAIQAWLARVGTPLASIPESRRCVSCDQADGGDRGWCDACWATIMPPEPAPAVTEPFETGCGRR